MGSQEFSDGGFEILLFAKRVGNHCAFIFNVTTHSLIDQRKHKVACTGYLRLNTKISTLSTYNIVLESNTKVHSLNKYQNAITTTIFDGSPMLAQNVKMEVLDVTWIQPQKT